jgi:asparagine synthase (glutamine-hydrolysing)
MCGITGIVDLRERRPIDQALLARMNGSLSHRGPDGDGFHFEPGVGFGHRRLSIIDLEGGKQPLYNEDHSVVVTYNGEIYNFHELEIELRARGHVFRTRCDTEVIVHAWEEWGKDCVDRFNGMFAFAIWDRNRGTLFVARDRLGVKPLYYAVLPDGRFLFASELKALLVCPELPRRIDPTAVEDYFGFGYVPEPKTIYHGIFKLEPGYRIVVRRGPTASVNPERYWDVPLDRPSEIQGGIDSSTAIVDGLRAAVARRLVADVPLGAFLSGGIDSSAVVAMMRDIGVDHLLTCSIGFTEPQYDESKYAQLVADQNRTDHKVEIVEASDYDLLDRLASIYDEPFADSSAIPTYRVCELARKHVTVALSGDGGDENFIGYRRYQLFDMEERVRAPIPLQIRRPVFGMLGQLYPKLDWAPRIFRAKTTFQSLARCSSEGYRHGVAMSSDAMRSALYSQSLKRELQGYGANQVFARHLADREFEDPLRMVQYLDFKTYLPGDILTKVDRASMAHSLEVRVPFLDFRLVEQVAKLPSELKLRRGEAKYALKKALEPYLPSEVLYRRKMGFAVPLATWFRGSLERRLDEVVSGQRLRDSGFFDPDGLARLLLEHRTKKRDHSAILWSLLMFDGFLRSAA